MTPDTVESTSPAPKPRARKPRTATAARAPRAASAPAQSANVNVSQEDFLGSVKAIIDASKPPQKVTVDNRRAYNPANPNNDPRPPFKYPFFQNFDKVDMEDLWPEEYRLIPLLKPGLFVKSRRGIPLVEVAIVKRGAQRGIHLRYDNKGDKGKELQVYCRDLTEMLQKCIAEAAKQAETKAARRAQGLPEDEDDD
jgi:hypothetical protein